MTWAGVAAPAVILAMAIDHRWGEPPARVHPVVGMGRYLGLIGPVLVRLGAGPAFIAGALAWVAGGALTMALAFAALTLLAGLAQGWVPNAWARDALLVGMLALLLKPMLSWRMLRDEVTAVEAALDRSLDEGRARLRHLVSRDVTALDAPAVRESAIESMAENLNDALVAPLFWFMVGGLPMAALYRFANTADAMWGYRGPYEWAGKWAAWMDDGMSWVPARLTALLLCCAAWTWPGLGAMRAQARRTPSPNGGWPMGTMALLLGVCLRKPGVYVLNGAGLPPQSAHTVKALQWSARAAWMAAMLCVAGLVSSSTWADVGRVRWPA